VSGSMPSVGSRGPRSSAGSISNMASDMSPTFEVAVDPEHLSGAPYKDVTGLLAVRLGQVWFPERSWSDFPVIVLGWWLGEAARLSEDVDGEFRFMDGPFGFRARKGPGGVRVTLEDMRGPSPSSVLEATVPQHMFCSAIQEASAVIFEACRNRGWESCDLGALSPSLGPRGRTTTE
jgi:hypothetical protein